MSTSDHPTVVLPKAEPSRVGPPIWVTRLFVALVVVPLATVVALFAVAMTGWGVETDPGDQLKRDLPILIAGAIAGAGCGAALGYALAGLRRAPILWLMALGALPAIIKATAYFTSSY